MPDIKAKKIETKSKLYIFNDIAIVSGKRTPFGKFNGAYKDISSTDLGAEITKKVLQDNSISPDLIDQVIFSNTIPSSKDSIFLPRHIALKSGMNYQTPASTVQRICASGMETIITAAIDIGLGVSDYIVAGGAENMTRAPLVSFDLRNGYKLGESPFVDLLWDGLFDTYCNLTMGQTAENLALEYNITRDEVDEFAYISHQRAINANKQNLFKDEIASCFDLEEDETIRNSVNLEKLKSLKTVFTKNGVQTAGNSSLIADGAAAVVVSGFEGNTNALGALKGAVIVAQKPEIMGISPVRAINLLLKEFNLNKDDIDLWEINEAFGAQYLAVEKALELDRNKVNVNGGSIAIGHPLAATGVRLIITLLYELKRRNAKYGIASACVGGGQGSAILVESV